MNKAQPSRAPLWPWFALAAVTLAAFALRWHDIRHSLWLDELHTSWTIWDGPGELALRARQGNQSPLYFYLVWAVSELFGCDELGLRLVSLTAGTALVAVVGAVVWRWTQAGIAMIVAAAFVACDGLCVYYSQDARPYACVQLVAVIQLAVLAELVANPTWRRRAGWIVLALAGFYLHYTFSLMLTGQWAYLLLPRKISKRPPGYNRAALADAGLVVLGMAPALLHVSEIAAVRDRWRAFIPEVVAWRAPYDWLMLFPLSLVVLLLILAATLEWRRWPAIFSGRTGTLLRLTLLWFLVPVVVAWLASWTGLAMLFYHRYTIAAAVGPALLAGLLIGAPWNVTTKAVFVVLGLISIPFVPLSVAQSWRHRGAFSLHSCEDWRAAAAWVRQRDAGAHTVVLVDSGLIEAGGDIPESFVLMPVNNIYDLRGSGRRLVHVRLDDPADLDRVVTGDFHGADRVFLIRRGARVYVERNVAELIPRLEQAGFAVESLGEIDWRGRPGISLAELRIKRGPVETPADRPPAAAPSEDR